MKAVSVFLWFVVLGLAESVSDEEWQSYKFKYNKSYPDPTEDALRKSNYEISLKNIASHNKLYEEGVHSYKLAVNQHSDRQTEEIPRGFKKMFTPPPPVNEYRSTGEPIPAEVDWRKKNVVTSVKDQGQCGTCWAFSATGAVEAQYAMKTGKLKDLSEKQLVDCVQPVGNCKEGKHPDHAFEYIESKGQESDKAYPYIPQIGPCEYNSSDVLVRLESYRTIESGNEQALQEAVAKFGPVSVGICGEGLSPYGGGIFKCECEIHEMNHAVLIVGYGANEEGQFYIVKNSWGENWGLNGYFLLGRNENNTAQVATLATVPVM